ncbi:MAG: aspartyl protease family protein [Candidatus Krumholzibacteria bacterium]|nr:aspartyl protease family protein [Candidatus Krumholzibacteria bacterium]
MRNYLVSILAASILAVSPRAVPARAGDAGELLARHLEALGGAQAVGAIRSLASSAEIEIMGTGLKGTVRSWSLRPCLSYSEIDLGFFKIREGYDGERLWMIDPNGKLQIRRDRSSLEYEKTRCVLDSRSYLFEGTGFAIEAAGRDTVNGSPYEVLSLRVDGGASARLFLDDSTFLLERMEIVAPEGSTVETYGDHRPIEGVMFPFFVRTELPALGQRIETRYRSISANEGVDPVIFLPPAADAKDYRFTRGGSAEELPFEYRSRHIYLPARIAGRDGELYFLLDSGASMTVIDSVVAAGMGLPLGGAIPGAGAGGMADFHMTRVPGLSIGGIELSEQIAITFPISNLLRRFEEIEIGGVLGYDFLSRFVTRIDFERSIITFAEPDSFSPGGGERIIEAPLVHNIFTLPASLDTAKVSFYLDTGANSSILQAGFAARSGIANGRRTLPMAIRGAGGDETASLCRFDSLGLGGFTIARPVLAIARSMKGIGVLENVDGIVGNDVLERFTVTLDYGKQRVFLEKNARFEEAFYPDRSGLQLARKENGSVVVVATLPDSPAARAGLRPGDLIVGIAGMNAVRFKSIREIMTLFEAKEGTTYRIEISRGGKRSKLLLTLESYL